MEKQQLPITGKNGAKYWCATINNYGDADICQFENIEEHCNYYIYGQEIGASGTRHLQCYLAFKRPKSLAALKRFWPTAHFEIANGTPQQASDYCKKDGKFMEFGILPEPQNKKGGEATKQKWKSLAELAVARKMEEIQEHHPKEFITNYRSLKQIGFDFSQKPKDLTAPCGVWIWGESGVGKSYTVRQENKVLYVKMMNKWWDNYDNEDVVLLEDMDPTYAQSMQYFMKIWADAYAFPVEIKNHSVMIRPKKFIVTSQYKPSDIWTEPKALEAIERRFQMREIVKLKEKDDIISKKRFDNPYVDQEVDLQDAAWLEKMVNPPSKIYKQVDGDIILGTPVKQPRLSFPNIAKDAICISESEEDSCTTTEELTDSDIHTDSDGIDSSEESDEYTQ